MILKTAMLLHVAYSDELILSPGDVERAVILLEDVLEEAPKALGGHGRSRSSVEMEEIIRKLRVLCPTDFATVLRANYRNTNKLELKEILETLEAMGRIKCVYGPKGDTDMKIYWINADGKVEGEKKI